MTEPVTAMPRAMQLSATTGLDAAKLIEAAKSKLGFARTELNKLIHERELRRVEISENARQKLQQIEEETQEALMAMNEDYARRAQPARDMIALVEKMLA